MMIVDDIGGLVPKISHSPWDGATLADFVFPFFLFIVGVSLALAYKVLLIVQDHQSIIATLLGSTMSSISC
jgi:predicted acyltransferase